MKNLKYTLILLSTLLFMVSCKNKNEHDNHKHSESETEHSDKEHNESKYIQITKAQFNSSKMQLDTLRKQVFPEVVKTTGMIDVPPQSKAVITSYYAGNVKKSNLLIGDKVRKGQALVTISNPEFIDLQQEYLEIYEQLNFLKTEYERQKTLFDEKITSQKNYLKAKSEYNRKKAKHNGLRKKLQMLHINPSAVESENITSTITLYAPISGSVTKVNVSKGTYVSPQDVVMEIINTDHIHIELTAFEKDVMRIKKGQKIRFKIPEASDVYHEAEVHLVGKSIDPKTRTILVHGHLHDETKNYFAVGMFVDAQIEILSKEGLALPEDAILEDDEHLVVLKLENEENGNYNFKPLTVEIGKKYNGFIEIKSDVIKNTDRILIKGGYSLVGAEGGGHSH